MTPSSKPGKVFLTGAGPGDPGLLTRKAARAIASCDVLVYDYLAAAPIVDLAAPSCEKIYAGKKAGDHSMPQEAITALLVRLARAGKTVVRLKGGDPYVFGRGGEEAQELHRAGIPFEVIPGITSAIAAPAYAGIPITHRDANTSFVVATGHEDPAKAASSIDWEKLANPHQTIVFLMAMGNLAGIVAELRKHGLDAQTPVAIVREGTRPAQQTLTGTLAGIVADVERAGIGAPAIVVIGKVAGMREEMRWFDRSPLFGKRVLITRPLAAAREFAERLWELGAEPIVAPTIRIVDPDDATAAADAVLRAHTYAWIAFTSRNGVERFFSALRAHGFDARRLGGVKLAAIGPKTAAALEAERVRADCLPEKFISEAIAAALLERTVEGDRVLLYRAQEARDVVPDLLRARGRFVDVVAAYKTEHAADDAFAAQAARADIITFTSASAVAGFCAALGRGAAAVAAGKLLACIGPVTAAAARDAGLRVDAVAQEFTVDGLLAALEHSRLSTV